MEKLTYSIPKYRPELPPTIISNLRIINENLVAIPSGRMDLIPEHYTIEDRRNTVPVEFPEFKFTLRPSQQEVYDNLNSDAFVNAWTSWGKTFTALAIAAKLGQKTLVIVHTKVLLDQWVKEVKKVFGITPSVIGGGKFETEGPITIATVQTLMRRNKLLFKESFGTIIVDECHHSPAKSFSDLLDTMNAKYKIGFSASDRRKDGLHVLFPDFFSFNKFTPPKENYMEPIIHRIHTQFLLDDGYGHWAHKVNNLCSNEEYQKMVALTAAIYAKKGHKVLVVGSRTKFLKKCHELTPKSCLVIGETKDRETEIAKLYSGEANILYGAENIFSEGVSENILSCIIFATPLNNDPKIEQLIGRIIRLQEGKLDPVVVDILLRGKTAHKQGQLRKGYYMRQGYKIVDL